MDNTAGGDHTASLAKTIPVGRLGTPHDVAATCVYLTSEESAWVTGQTLHVNGGTLMA
jgi:3-oxoacyl-[acyl-carrier protein] reductase